MKFDQVNSVKIDEKELQKLEEITTINLPKYLKDFLKKYSGQALKINGIPCSVLIKHSDGYTQSTYIYQVETIENIINTWKYRDFLLQHQKHFELQDSYVQVENLFPIIELPNSEIYVAINGLHDKKIYYVDNGDFGIIKIADSLNKFMKNLCSKN
jgi:hypothetical protein